MREALSSVDKDLLQNMKGGASWKYLEIFYWRVLATEKARELALTPEERLVKDKGRKIQEMKKKVSVFVEQPMTKHLN